MRHILFPFFSAIIILLFLSDCHSLKYRRVVRCNRKIKVDLLLDELGKHTKVDERKNHIENVNEILAGPIADPVREYEKEALALKGVPFSIFFILITILGTWMVIKYKRKIKNEKKYILHRKGKRNNQYDYPVIASQQLDCALDEIKNTDLDSHLSDLEKRLDHLERESSCERMIRLRQIGRIGSIVLLREKKRISDETAWRMLKKELIYIHDLEGNEAGFIRWLDHELDGMVANLRKDLQLVGKPREVLFLCCCILNMDTVVLADLTGKDSLDAIYKKRSRLKSRIMSLGKPEYDILFKK